MLAHHASKKQRSQPGQALRGSSDLHAIGDCNAYLARAGDQIMLTIELRAARSPEPMMLELAGGDDEETHLRVRVGGSDRASSKPDLGGRVVDALTRAAEPLSRSALRTQLRVNNKRLGDALAALASANLVVHTGAGWSPVHDESTLPGETQAGSAGVQPAKG